MARGKPGVTGARGRVKITTRGHIAIDMQKVADAIGPAIVGHVLERVDAGLDTKDAPFEPYTPEYVAFLVAGGEDTKVDLRLTGGMLGSVKVRSSKVAPDSCTVVVGPGTGTSPQVRPVKGRMKRTGARGPAHNVVGKHLQQKRPWLGLSPKGKAKLKKLLERLGVFTSGP